MPFSIAFDIPSKVASILWNISHLKSSLLLFSLSSKSQPTLAECTIDHPVEIFLHLLQNYLFADKLRQQ